jgi:hypothetical protein
LDKGLAVQKVIGELLETHLDMTIGSSDLKYR